MTSGQIALHYEDYVLSMQYFNQIISLRPYLYQPWQYRAIAKYYLDDYVGAEEDAAEAIKLNPYIEDIYDLRAISRIRQISFKRLLLIIIALLSLIHVTETIGTTAPLVG